MKVKKIVAGTATAALLVTSLASCSPAAVDDGVVNISYQTLAWQSSAIEANKEIVANWNAENPEIQVEYIQGDWGSIGDELTAGFEGGKAPDVFHFYDTGLQAYAERGNLLDLTSYLSDEFLADIRPDVWPNVSFSDAPGRWGVPFLQEPTIVFANKEILEAAGIPVPTIEDPWTWDEYQDIAKQLTSDSTYGASIALLDRTDTIIGLGQSFGGEYFSADGLSLKWGAPEAEVPERVHEMLHIDKSMSVDVLGLRPSDLLPAFFDGQYATMIAGAYLRQQIIEGAPDGFEWVALPSLLGETQEQSNGAQTISISAQTEHPEEATLFLEYLLNPDNQVKLALGDWLAPTSIGAGESAELKDSALGWDVTINAAANLRQAAYQQVPGWDEWLTKVGHPAFADYFAGNITVDELKDRLEAEGNPVLEKAASR